MNRLLVMAIFAIVLGPFAVAGAQPNPSNDAVVHQVLQQALADKPETDVVVITVEYAPGGSTPPHAHPGDTYGYVLEGAVVSQVGDEKPRTYTAGQMFTELPNQHHMVSRNASATEPAKLLVFMIAPHGEKLTTMLPSGH